MSTPTLAVLTWLLGILGVLVTTIEFSADRKRGLSQRALRWRIVAWAACWLLALAGGIVLAVEGLKKHVHR